MVLSLEHCRFRAAFAIRGANRRQAPAILVGPKIRAAETATRLEQPALPVGARVSARVAGHRVAKKDS